jgi:hypothetical protein
MKSTAQKIKGELPIAVVLDAQGRIDPQATMKASLRAKAQRDADAKAWVAKGMAIAADTRGPRPGKTFTSGSGKTPKTDAEFFAAYQAMETRDRRAFFAKHRDAIWRGYQEQASGK